MIDDSHLWTHKPAPRCRPRPGEPLWSIQKGDVTWSAELRYHGEYSVEAQILRNGELALGRRFHLKEHRRCGGPKRRRRTRASALSGLIRSRRTPTPSTRRPPDAETVV